MFDILDPLDAQIEKAEVQSWFSGVHKNIKSKRHSV